MSSPVASHWPVVPSACTARQPTTIAVVQKSTSNGSTVINVEPTASSGAVLHIATIQNPAAALTSFAMKRSRRTLTNAEMTGDRKRTPSSRSPQIEVPANCASAIISGLL
jgi:hypothetical protein